MVRESCNPIHIRWITKDPVLRKKSVMMMAKSLRAGG